MHLLTRDNGWLAAYYDVLTRLSRTQQQHIAEGNRLHRLYSAYHGSAAKANAAAGVFPKNADLLMLLTSLKWEANGDLQIPGGLGAWEGILTRKTKSNSTREWIRRGRSWDSPDRLLETLVSSSNFDTESGPMQIFLMLSAMNAARPKERSLSDADGTIDRQPDLPVQSLVPHLCRVSGSRRYIHRAVCRRGGSHRRHFEPHSARQCARSISGRRRAVADSGPPGPDSHRASECFVAERGAAVHQHRFCGAAFRSRQELAAIDTEGYR